MSWLSPDPLSRPRGWRKPVGAVVVARPSMWGNPFVVRAGRTRAAAVAQFEQALLHGDCTSLPFTIDDLRRELAGVDVACWCPLDEQCHGDVLLRLANAPPATRRRPGFRMLTIGWHLTLVAVTAAEHLIGQAAWVSERVNSKGWCAMEEESPCWSAACSLPSG